MNTYSLDIEKDSSQYTYAADSASISITGDLTLEAWIKIETLLNVDLMGKWDDVVTNDRCYEINLTSLGKFQFSNSSNGTNSTSGAVNSTAMTTGIWYHIAVSYNAAAGTCAYYLNGVADGTGSGLLTSIFNSTKAFMLGAQDSASPQRFCDLKVKEVRIWNDIRTAAEIADNFKREIAVDSQGLVAYWKLNNSYLDETSNNNDLTAVGSPVFSADVPFFSAPFPSFLQS